MRKTICLLLCAVMLVFAAGCSAPALTPDEYYEQLMTEFGNFRDATNSFMGELQSKSLDTSLCDAANDALDRMEALSPPETYRELHKKLCDGIQTERDYMSVIKETLEAAKIDPNDPKIESNGKKLEELAEKSVFAAAIIEIAAKYKGENP